MIVRESCGIRLVDLEAVSILLNRSRATIRLKCSTMACDVKTRRGLYDPDSVTTSLSLVPRRRQRVDKKSYIRV